MTASSSSSAVRYPGSSSTTSSSRGSLSSSLSSSKGYVPHNYRRPRNPRPAATAAVAVPNYNSRGVGNRFGSTIGNEKGSSSSNSTSSNYLGKGKGGAGLLYNTIGKEYTTNHNHHNSVGKGKGGIIGGFQKPNMVYVVNRNKIPQSPLVPWDKKK